MQQQYITRAERIMQRIQQLAAISEDADGLTRTFGTPAFLAGRALVHGWLEAAGLPTRVDGIGNLRARLLSATPAARTFVLASHIDTVVNAGKFDGPLGVLMGLDLLVFDAEKTYVVTADLLQHKHQVAPYICQELTGVVEQTFLKGTPVYQRPVFAHLNHGEFLTR